jgi:hypothetical protein
MSRRNSFILAAAGCGLFAVFAAPIAMLRMAAEPRVRVIDAASTRRSNDGSAAIRAVIRAHYIKLFESVSKGNSGPVDLILAPDFSMDRLWGERIVPYDRKSWIADVARRGANRSRWAALATPDGLRLQRTNEVNVRLDSIKVAGDHAEVLATVKYTFGASQYPQRTSFSGVREVTEKDTWIKLGADWKLQRIEVQRTKNSSEAFRG